VNFRVSKYPLLKEGQPRRSKNVTLPQSHRRGVGRSDNALLYDLPRFALAKVAWYLLRGLNDPSLRRGNPEALKTLPARTLTGMQDNDNKS
jgi:hypothetical protein